MRLRAASNESSITLSATPSDSGGLWRGCGASEVQILLGNGATELLHWLARVSAEAAGHAGRRQSSRSFTALIPRLGACAAEDPGRVAVRGSARADAAEQSDRRRLPPDLLERWLLGTSNPVLIDESFLEFTGLPPAARLLERRAQL